MTIKPYYILLSGLNRVDDISDKLNKIKHASRKFTNKLIKAKEKGKKITMHANPSLQWSLVNGRL